jgi:GT2 family glycosyltransferase
MNDIIFIIPTINSEKYIVQLKNYLEKYKVNYFFFVDRKTSDNTYKVLKNSTDNVDFYENNELFLENSIEQIYSKFVNYYIFRLDDDEIPTPNLIINLKKYVNKKKKIFGIRRFEAFLYDNKEYISGPLSCFESII